MPPTSVSSSRIGWCCALPPLSSSVRRLRMSRMARSWSKTLYSVIPATGSDISAAPTSKRISRPATTARRSTVSMSGTLVTATARPASKTPTPRISTVCFPENGIYRYANWMDRLQERRQVDQVSDREWQEVPERRHPFLGWCRCHLNCSSTWWLFARETRHVAVVYSADFILFLYLDSGTGSLSLL